MQNKADGSHSLSVNNFRSEINKLFVPHQQKIQAASNHFKQKYLEYKSSHLFKKSVQYDTPVIIDHQRSPSYFSELSFEQEAQPAQKQKQIAEGIASSKYELREWQPCSGQGFNDSETIKMFYNELFSLKKARRHKDKESDDFKKDEKELIVRLFNELKGKDNYVTFESVEKFFSQCKLYYLCYNIQPQQLIGVLKDSAHQKHDRLTMNEFLNIFFADRPNLIHYSSERTDQVKAKCVLSEDSWKELKAIFATLDTFGNETIYMGPFLYKIKNNYSNRALIDEPAIEFAEIGRTITLKKVVFNIEFRHKINEKVKWQDVEAIFHNYEHRDYPTIDCIYQRMVETGQISKYTNAFMLKPDIIEEIKKIYYRCPKYCDFFVKSRFICKQMLQSLLIKNHLREGIVRIVEEGRQSRFILLQEQIRIIATESQEFIDLDQLLEYFSIKGLLSTAPQIDSHQKDSSDEENQIRIRQLQKAKSLQRLNDLNNDHQRGYKPVRHLTVCHQFSLSKKKGQTIMERKTKQMKEQKERAIEKQLKTKFKANPIPAELNPERYRAYLKKMEEQKQLRRQQIEKNRQAENRVYQYLKTNTLLFTTKEKEKPTMINHSYHYAAKPIPWHLADTDMLQKINEKKKLRRKKMTTDAKMKILKEWKDLPDVAREFTQPSEAILEELESSLQPNQSKHIVKEVPNFAKLHKEFAESLEKKKKEWNATKPVEFNFSTYKPRQKIEKSNNVTTKLLKRVKSVEKFKKSESPHHKTSVQTYIVKEKVNIPTTIKHEQLCNFNQQKRQNQAKEQQRQKKQEINRKAKQRNFAKLMRKKLHQNLRKSQSLHQLVSSKSKKHRQDWKKLQKQTEEDLCRIYFSVMNRPFLFETSNTSKVPINTIPTLDKSKKQRRLQKQDSSKHIHQSPLKAYDPQNIDSKQSFRFQPEPCLEEEAQNAYLNQSF